jgi:uncharacterized protein (DUF924 family)
MSNEVLECWFDRASCRYWFDASPDFDELVRRRLTPLYADAIEGRVDHWKDHPDGALALCILFDQVPRNIFRGSARAFATDTEARSVARHILAFDFDRAYAVSGQAVLGCLPRARRRLSAVADNIRDQNRRDLTRSPHGAPSGPHLD